MNESGKLPARIVTEADLQAGLKALRGIDPLLTPIIDGLDWIPLRNRAPGFEGLAEIIVSQHVSKTSAAAVFGRLLDAVDPFEPQAFLKAGGPAQVAAGLSRAKQKTLTRLSKELFSGTLDLEHLCKLPVGEAQAALVALPGVGSWTAEIFLMFCAGHPDIFPASDVALRQAAGQVAGLAARPDEKTCRSLAKRWQPLRSVAARVLYAHYAQLKGRSAAPV